MGNPLRDRRSPSDLAACGQVIEFEEKIGDLERLAAAVQADLTVLGPDTLPAGWREAPVNGRLTFGFADAQNRLPVLDGHVVATVDTVCQRCLAPFRRTLDLRLRLMFAADASGGMESGEYELWELPEATLRPLDVVDESLVMAMPLAAMHADEAICSGRQPAAAEAAERIRPFAGLKAQMDKQKQD